MRPSYALEALRTQIQRIEARHKRSASVLPFGLAPVDARLPNGGLAFGALHEVAGAGNGVERERHPAVVIPFAVWINLRVDHCF